MIASVADGLSAGISRPFASIRHKLTRNFS